MEPQSRPDSPSAREAARAADAEGLPSPGSTAPVPAASPQEASHRPLRPIGLERLLALREAIRNGTYPSEEVVATGLERMLRSDRGADA